MQVKLGSLFGRFQGCLLGAAIGGVLGNAFAQSGSRPWLSELQAGTVRSLSLGAAVGWETATVEIVRLLLERDTDGVGDRLRALQQIGNGAEALGAVPLGLLCHEMALDVHPLIATLPNLSPTSWILGTVVGEILRGKWHPETMLSAIAARFPHTAFASSGMTPANCLLLAQGLVADRKSLASAVSSILASAPPEEHALILALYSFLATPESFSLTVGRTLAAAVEPSLSGAIAGALAGALAGAQNGMANIPLDWRLALDRPTAAMMTPIQTLWGIPSTTDLLHLATRLCAMWCGIYKESETESDQQSEELCNHPYRIPAVTHPSGVRSQAPIGCTSDNCGAGKDVLPPPSLLR